MLSNEYHSGFVAIVGRPNVGKSTLMNAMIGEKIAIVSDKPQTTRNRIQCVLTRKNYQIVFVDTPGIHKPKNKLGEYMVGAARTAMSDMDAVLFLVDGADGIGGGDRHIAEMLKDCSAPVVLAVNKIDKAQGQQVARDAAELSVLGGFDRTVEISASVGTNLHMLEEILLSYLPEGPQYYPEDMITDQPERLIISELIREKALSLLKEEVPHGIGVEIERMEERQNAQLVDIFAAIYCEKTSHKGIIIGKGGRMLKDIGSKARADIEGLLGTKVYLELWVKVKDDWRNDSNTLSNLGYNAKKD